MQKRLIFKEAFSSSKIVFKNLPPGAMFTKKESDYNSFFVKLKETIVVRGKSYNAVKFGVGLVYIRWNTDVRQLEVE